MLLDLSLVDWYLWVTLTLWKLDVCFWLNAMCLCIYFFMLVVWRWDCWTLKASLFISLSSFLCELWSEMSWSQITCITISQHQLWCWIAVGLIIHFSFLYQVLKLYHHFCLQRWLWWPKKVSIINSNKSASSMVPKWQLNMKLSMALTF